MITSKINFCWQWILDSNQEYICSIGQLLRYEQFTFDRETLQTQVEHLIQEWEHDINEKEDDLTAQETPWKITQIATEGENGYILKAWADALPDLSVIRVSPEEWRSVLLLPKEKSNSSNAKAAARLVARQIV